MNPSQSAPALSVGALIGIVLGSVAAAAAIGGILLFKLRTSARRMRDKGPRLTPAHLSGAFKATTDALGLSQFTDPDPGASLPAASNPLTDVLSPTYQGIGETVSLASPSTQQQQQGDSKMTLLSSLLLPLGRPSGSVVASDLQLPNGEQQLTKEKSPFDGSDAMAVSLECGQDGNFKVGPSRMSGY